MNQKVMGSVALQKKVMASVAFRKKSDGFSRISHESD
jgi:hypothetical protein